MQIICISRGSFARGQGLAEILAKELGYKVVSREDLFEAAVKEGIQVGKLETAMMKPHAFTERLARERDYYLAFSTAYLCDQAKEGSLVYHGRTGHLLLCGVGHLLRVRVIANEEYRLRAAMQRLGVSEEKARRYIADVELDRRAWVHAMYGVSWEDAAQYDVIINVEQMSVENAAASLVGMAQLPDFQLTPASMRTLENLRLRSGARLLLARDERTARCVPSVNADDGILTVTYLPKDAEFAPDIQRVLAKLEGAKEIRATMAATNILWVQEAFERGSETFKEVTEIARKWNAAVEVVRYVPGDGSDGPASVETVASVDASRSAGGIEVDVEEPADEGGLKATLDELARLGRSGGGREVCGARGPLLQSLCRQLPYSLVVLGNLFLDKGASARLRLTRELQDAVSSRMRVPVVTADELRRRYLFGTRDVIRLVVLVVFLTALYVIVLNQQEPILRFLFGAGHQGLLAKLTVAVAVFCFVPIVAYSYGSVARLLLKLIKME